MRRSFQQQQRAQVRFPALPAETDLQRNFRSLKIWHWIAGTIHLVSGILLVSLYIGLGLEKSKAFLFVDVLKGRDAGGDAVVENKFYSSYEIFWVLFPMPLVTALAHAIQGCLLSDPTSSGKWYRDQIASGVNEIRWIEYATTASLMTWIVAQLSGITNVELAWIVGVMCNVALQLQGWQHEIWQRSGVTEDYLPFVSGFVIFAAQWITIIYYYTRTIAEADETVPFYVHFIVWGLMGSYLTFPAVQLWFWGRFKPSAQPDSRAFYWYEWWFIMLSLASKLLLDWTLFGGIVSLS